MKMDNRHIKPETGRWHDVAYWVLLIAVCVVFFVLNLWTSYKEDDMEFSLLRDAGFMDFLRAQYDHFLVSNGRCADFFATIFCAYLGKPVYNVCNTLVFALMAHLVSLLSTGRRSLMVLALFIAYVGVAYPVPGQTMLFVAGSCNYMWAITASLLLVYLLQRVCGKRLSAGKTILLMVLAFVAGNFNEATSFGVFGGLVLYYIFNRKEFDRNAKWAMVAYLLGVAVIFISPAAWERASQGGVVTNLGLGELIKTRTVIFTEKMVRVMMPIAALIVGIVVLCWKGLRPVKHNVWGYILICQALLMFVLGYFFDRAYAPMATSAFIIVAMAADALFLHGRWAAWMRWLVIALSVLLGVYGFARGMRVLHSLKLFEDNIEHEITSAPRHAILHEYHFNGYSRFATPLRYASAEYFNRESTFCAYYDKDNVQFVPDSVYNRYHSGRLLDGARLLPIVSDRPEIADTVLGFPDQDYMVVLINADTLGATPQYASYYFEHADSALRKEDVQFRETYGLISDYEYKGFYPLYFQGRQLLILPLINDATTRIEVPLDYNEGLGTMTLRRKHQTPVSQE